MDNAQCKMHNAQCTNVVGTPKALSLGRGWPEGPGVGNSYSHWCRIIFRTFLHPTSVSFADSLSSCMIAPGNH